MIRTCNLYGIRIVPYRSVCVKFGYKKKLRGGNSHQDYWLLVWKLLMFGMLPVCWNIGVGFCFVNKDDSPVVFQVVFHLFDLPHYGIAV